MYKKTKELSSQEIFLWQFWGVIKYSCIPDREVTTGPVVTLSCFLMELPLVRGASVAQGAKALFS